MANSALMFGVGGRAGAAHRSGGGGPPL